MTGFTIGRRKMSANGRSATSAYKLLIESLEEELPTILESGSSIFRVLSMRNIQLKIAIAALLAAAPCHADSPGYAGDQASSHMMFYSSIPLDGSPRQKDAAMRFGLRLDHARGSHLTIGRDWTNDPVNSHVPAFFDISLNGNRLPEMKINGINALTYSLVTSVTGGAEVAAIGVNWAYVGYGVIAVLAVDMERDDPEEPPVVPVDEEPDGCGPEFTLNIC
jgi:hypothetical protein